MLQVKPLTMRCFIIDYTYGSNMVDYVTCLRVEKIVTTIIASVSIKYLQNKLMSSRYVVEQVQ